MCGGGLAVVLHRHKHMQACMVGHAASMWSTGQHKAKALACPQAKPAPSQSRSSCSTSSSPRSGATIVAPSRSSSCAMPLPTVVLQSATAQRWHKELGYACSICGGIGGGGRKAEGQRRSPPPSICACSGGRPELPDRACSAECLTRDADNSALERLVGRTRLPLARADRGTKLIDDGGSLHPGHGGQP